MKGTNYLMMKKKMNDSIKKIQDAEIYRCISVLRKLVDEKITPINPEYVIVILGTIDKAIIWRINELEKQVKKLQLLLNENL